MILHLNLKRKWFDLIAKGEKLEEYREIKAHWVSRLIERTAAKGDFSDAIHVAKLLNQKTNPAAFLNLGCKFKPFTHVRFQNGYSKNATFITFEVREICISEGVPQWGATAGELYFVIKLGERIC